MTSDLFIICFYPLSLSSKATTLTDKFGCSSVLLPSNWQEELHFPVFVVFVVGSLAARGRNQNASFFSFAHI